MKKRAVLYCLLTFSITELASAKPKAKEEDDGCVHGKIVKNPATDGYMLIESDSVHPKIGRIFSYDEPKIKKYIDQEGYYSYLYVNSDPGTPEDHNEFVEVKKVKDCEEDK